MTKEEKQLLIKDLSARLPYKVLVHCDFTYYLVDVKKKQIHDIDDRILYSDVLGMIGHQGVSIKPYLRPMLSMTEEEYKEYRKAGEGDTLDSAIALKQRAEGKRYISSWYRGTDWLLKHHFDFRGLIEKGLALEAPEGMYNE